MQKAINIGYSIYWKWTGLKTKMMFFLYFGTAVVTRSAAWLINFRESLQSSLLFNSANVLINRCGYFVCFYLLFSVRALTQFIKAVKAALALASPINSRFIHILNVFTAEHGESCSSGNCIKIRRVVAIKGVMPRNVVEWLGLNCCRRRFFFLFIKAE